MAEIRVFSTARLLNPYNFERLGATQTLRLIESIFCAVLKSIKISAVFLLLLFILFDFTLLFADDSIPPNIVPGVFLVKYKGQRDELKRFSVLSTVKNTQVGDVYKVRLNQAMSSEEGKRLLLNQPDVAIVEPLRLIRVCGTYNQPLSVPNDTYLNRQWYVNAIDLPAAWDVTRGSSNVVVAVIDTGVDYNHVDLQGSMWLNPGESPGDGVDNDGNGYKDDVMGWDFVDLSNDPEGLGIVRVQGEDYDVQDADPMDRIAHGTHIAGIIAAQTDNAVGVAGIAPDVRIMALRAGFDTLDGGFLTSESIINSLAYARRNGANVINMSFGDTVDDKLIYEQLQLAYQAGIVLVAAAGNETTDVRSYPAAYPFVISVAALDSNNRRAGFSNYGTWVDIAAPGQTIFSTVSSIHESNLNNRIVNDGANNLYAPMSGTSMASPVVAGVAALFLSQNPQLSPEEVEYILKQTADPCNSADVGAGRVNARKVMSYLLTYPLSGTANKLIKKLYVAPNPFDKSAVDQVKIKVLINSDINEIWYDIYSVSGEKVVSGYKYYPLIDSYITAISWDGSDNQGERLPIGVYYLLLKVKDSKGQSDAAKTKIVITH
ncbi:MAG: hypothetical protein A2X43_08255 [Candidatus Margulisbacteria bacterium GWD2_39_127]|nr:MAG: hypothetical protein A2X43_08255 [Candidatus Margulisbacteria bacterium GWD2_39_127]OGI11665.1 MAG: hypothetical protein A2X41_10275 [Candidatus Margulisbacteria bacterium GWE2_39_32]